MDILLLTLGFTCVIAGIIGSFLPVLPGPPLSWLGLLFLYFTEAVAMNYWILGISFVLTAVITILDYVIPAKGTKRFGGSKYGVWGTKLCFFLVIFAPILFVFIIGPFVGAFVGERHYNSTDHRRALKAATGSLLGFLASSFMSFVFCVGLLGLFISIVWTYRAGLF
jgi:uncharacterized protein YqgC (DUF456 family)